MNVKVLSAFALATLAASQSACAWGPQGHRLVGSLADQLLAASDEQKVVGILGYDLRTASTWADCVRSVHKLADGTFKFIPDKFTASCTAFETPEEEARMEDYASRNWDNCDHRPNQGCNANYHFADIPTQFDQYSEGGVGASDHDVVHAIDACLAVLQGRPAPAPFSIKDKKEALLLLSHFVGDIHQPLHVGAEYLDESGTQVTPTKDNAEQYSTAGGNFIMDGSQKLHAEWDKAPTALGDEAGADLVAEARKVVPTSGPVGGWSAKWATDTVVASHTAFGEATFAGAQDDSGKVQWTVSFDDRQEFLATKREVQEQQIAKAGARLAQAIHGVQL